MIVALLDYGAGNLHSLRKALEAGGARTVITPEWDRALAADALVLPGVGSFGAAVNALEGERERIREALEAGLPCLGICLGMQLLLEGSEEAAGTGIGVVPGRVWRLRARRVPHMGWNEVVPGSDPLFGGSPLEAYFAHSYVCEPADPSAVIAWTSYGGRPFPAALRKGRTWGVQFHPEKSSRGGLELLRRFLVLAGEAR